MALAAVVLLGTSLGWSALAIEVVRPGQGPVAFEENMGQADTAVRFLARGQGYGFYLSATQAVMVLTKADGASIAPSRNVAGPGPVRGNEGVEIIRLSLPGANPRDHGVGVDRLSGVVNYFIGNDPSQWRAGIPLFDRVQFANVFPGVTLDYYGREGQLEFDFTVAPGADPSVISLRFDGADRIDLEPAGDLVLQAGGQVVRQHKPMIYQMINGVRREISGGYHLVGDRTVRFELGAYAESVPLVIDPVFSYASYIGSRGLDTAWAVKVDAAGAAYVAGEVKSSLTNISATAFQNRFRGGNGVGNDAFVAKFDPTGSSLVYLTYLGGTGNDSALGLAVDGSGNAYVTGYTDSANFPIQGGFQSKIKGTSDPTLLLYKQEAFVTKLNPTGSALVYSSYLGGNGTDLGVGIAVDAAGAAYVAGTTFTINNPRSPANAFPVVNALQTNNAGGSDVFVSKVQPDGSALVFSTFLGGTGSDQGEGVALDPSGNIYVTGWTTSSNFPVANAFQPVWGGAEDVFVTKFDPTGASLLYSTYLGGTLDDVGYRIAVGADGSAYVTGTRVSAAFPLTPGALNRGSLFASTGAAINWTDSAAGIYNNVVNDLVAGVGSPTTIYAATARGVFKSLDSGTSWISASSGMTSLAARALAADPLDPLRLYAATDGGVFKTVDGGANWSLSKSNLNNLNARSILALPPATVLVGTTTGLARSTNGTANWKSIGIGGSYSVNSLVADPSAPSVLYAGISSGVIKSTNGGINWVNWSKGLTNRIVRSVAVDPLNPQIIYAATAGGIFQTLNGATNWNPINNGLGVGASNLNANVIVAGPGVLYAGTTHGFFHSIDAGANWVVATNGLTSLDVHAVAVGSTPTTLFLGAYQTNQLKTNDVFVTKLQPDGSAPAYSISIGGDKNDIGWDIAVDALGRAHVSGSTQSTNFPVVQAPSIVQTTNAGSADVFVAQVSADGAFLDYSFYLGGRYDDFGYGLAVDSAGGTYLVGRSSSTNMVSLTGVGTVQKRYTGSGDAFIIKLMIPPVVAAIMAADGVRVRWIAPSPEFILESSESLVQPAQWHPVPQLPVVIDGYHTVTLPASPAVRLFRLRQP